jgi:CheY-like chemotaxis protein
MKNILVVDDDRMMLEVISRILAGQGMLAHCASSGAQALDIMREKSFHLMITDLNMPGLDGLELSRKTLELAPHMRIIMDTGDASPGNLSLAKEIGISRILHKPFLPDQMLEAIWEVMEREGAPCS